MRTLPKVNPVNLSFLISFLLAAITVPLTLTLTNTTHASLATRALVLIVGMGLVALVVIVVALLLSLRIQSHHHREITQLRQETHELKQSLERRRWEHRFATYYLDPAFQEAQIRRSRRKSG